MCDQDHHAGPVDLTYSRRDFPLTASVAGGSTGAGGAQTVVDREVNIRTPDGEAEAFVTHPAGPGPWPAVVVWTDIFGLRPVFRDIARRLAAEGYVVLVANPFYRVLKGLVGGGKPLNFANEEDRNYLMGLGGGITPEFTATDSKAYIAWLDALPEVDKSKAVGVHGYCLGAALAIRTAAAVPDRVAAAAGFHGARLVNDQPTSTHLLIPKSKAEHLQIIAQNDDDTDPNMKEGLKQVLAESGTPGRVDVYQGAMHGWCIPGAAVYDEALAEKAWAELLDLYKRRLA